MRLFMDHAQTAFADATGWSYDSSYSALNATSDALLAFSIPRGVRLSLSSLATPHFATSYQLGSVGVVDGSVSYLFSSVPLAAHLTAASARVPLGHLSRAYRPLHDLSGARRTRARIASPSEEDGGATATQRRSGSRLRLRLPSSSPTLLYGRLYLPTSLLEALLVTRPSRWLQLRLSAVSSPTLRNGGSILGAVQYDVGRFALEGLASSDGGLMGFRGIYNFGGDLDNPIRTTSPSDATSEQVRTDGAFDGAAVPPPQLVERERIYGRFTAGGEIYYGMLNKSGGVSVGARFATLPAHKGTPLTATLTINPLMGSIAATYAVAAGRRCSLATRFDFNVYSYDSNWSVGVELWRTGQVAEKATANSIVGEGDTVVDKPYVSTRSFRAKMEWRLDTPDERVMVPTAPLTSPAILLEPPSPLALPPSNTARRKDKKREGPTPPPRRNVEVAEATKLAINADTDTDKDEKEYRGVLKARLDQTLKLGLIWEGRVQSLLYSVGSGIDLRKPDQPFRMLGLEIQYSS